MRNVYMEDSICNKVMIIYWIYSNLYANEWGMFIWMTVSVINWEVMPCQQKLYKTRLIFLKVWFLFMINNKNYDTIYKKRHFKKKNKINKKIKTKEKIIDQYVHIIKYYLESFIVLLLFHNDCATQKYVLRKITGHFRQCQNQRVRI